MRSTTRLAAGLALAVSATSASAVTLLNESFTGAVGTQPAGFVAFADAGMNSINDGASEYEQRRVSANGVSIANYQVLNDIDQGAWRDTTAQAITRYSGAANNLNGLIVRARDITNTTSGDMYHVRLNGNNVELFRVNNGVFTNLGSVAVAGGLGAIQDRLLEVTTANIADADTDNVNISIKLYTGATNATAVVATLNFLDTAPNAITSGGGVGFRSNITTGSSARSTFDDLVVTGNNDALRFYDDYASGKAIRMQTFSNAGTTDGSLNVITQKYAFNHGSTSQTSLGLVDFDSATASWVDTRVTAQVRLNTLGTNSSELATGLILRETGVANNVSNAAGSFYHFRLDRIENANSFQAQLLRKDGAAGFVFLSTLNLSNAQIPESTDIYLSFSAVNQPGGVQLIGFVSLNADFSNPFGKIEFFDTSANAILTGGSAGFRSFGIGSTNFDNFTVTLGIAAIPEPAALTLLGLAGLGLMRRRRMA